VLRMIRDPNKVEAYLQIIEGQGVLQGRFNNVRRINPEGGGGVFSLVCLATDMQTGEEVVLKFFNPDFYTPTDLYRWESFRRESTLLGQLTGSRDIITLISGHAEFVYRPVPTLPLEWKFAYYAVEKALGSLEDVIALKSWTVIDCLKGFRVAVRAVQRIHLRHIFHRDLKPGNFLLTTQGLKLSDFGTARALTAEGEVLRDAYIHPPGDRRYVAPEMMACLHDVDASYAFAGDFFALGAILFEMFTGTNLGVKIFGPQLLSSLTLPMSTVPRQDRVKIFHQIIGPIASRYPLPAIETLNPQLLPCVRDRLNDLYRGLCALDHRQRTQDFNSVFRSIDTCLLIIENETHYLSWLREKQKRRAVRLAKKNGVAK